MNRNSRIALAVCAAVLMAAVPVSAFAQSGALDIFPIVTCGTATTQPCTPCGFLDILENIVKFITVGVTGPIAALLFIYAGVLFLIAGGNSGMISRAKTVMTNTVYGVAIILVSWLVITTLIKTIAPNSDANKWYEFSCPAFLQGPGIVPEAPAPVSVGADGGAVSQLPPDQKTCGDISTMAKAYGANSNPKADSDALKKLRDCILKDPIVKQMTDTEQLFTYEREPEFCNVTRGIEICPGDCEHAKYSCHYGGRTGDDGAEAVDFNWNKKVAEGTRKSGEKYRLSGERQLADEILRSAKENSCDFRLIKYHSTPGKEHTHVSTTACDSDGKGTGKTAGLDALVDNLLDSIF